MAEASPFRNTFTLLINEATIGRFASVDALEPTSQASPGIDVETMKLRRMQTPVSKVDGFTLPQASSALGRVSKVEALSIKQKVSSEQALPLEANTALVLHGFTSAGQNWNPTSLQELKIKYGEIVLWDAAAQPVARYKFTQAWPSKVPPDPGAAAGDFVLLVQGLQRVDLGHPVPASAQIR